MTQQAGDVEKGLLWKQEHLSPLPIPTGEPASDILGMIWRKDDVYLDIGSISLSGGWFTLYSLSLMFSCLILYLIFHGLYVDAFIFFIIFGCGLMGFLWIGYIRAFRRPLIPPVRFHRQRREVRITNDKGEEWTVPWERVHAIAPSATMVGQFGAAKMGGLLLWFPLKDQIDEPYHENKDGWVIMVSPGPGIAAMRQWECIRSFMEIGPDAVPEQVPAADEKSLRQIFVEEFHKARERHGLFVALVWHAGIGQVVLNPMVYLWLHKKKFAVVPDLTSPEAIAWSQPLPQEQWAQRSPELEAAMAERERDLAEMKSAEAAKAA